MTSQDFLKEKAEQLASLFPASKYSYEYNEFAGVHIVQVWPLTMYNDNDQYKTLETSISLEFDRIFAPESVLFVSEDSLNQVSGSVFEVSGILFGFSPVNAIPIPSFNAIIHETYTCGINNYALAA